MWVEELILGPKDLEGSDFADRSFDDAQHATPQELKAAVEFLRKKELAKLCGRRGHTSAWSATRATFAVLLVLDRTTTTYHHHLDIGIGIGIAAPSPSIGTVP